MTMVICFALSGCSTLISHSRSGNEQDVYAKRSFGTAIDDTAIVGKIESRLRAINEQYAAMINVDAYNRVVLLTGRAPDLGFIKDAVQAAALTQGVRQVHNEIQTGNAATMSTHWSDTWLTTKTRSQLALTSNAPASKTKVRSDQGIIYLMGVMTEQEARNAIYVASRIPGAVKIVSLIEAKDPKPNAAIIRGLSTEQANQPPQLQQQQSSTQQESTGQNQLTPANTPAPVYSSSDHAQLPAPTDTNSQNDESMLENFPIEQGQSVAPAAR